MRTIRRAMLRPFAALLASLALLALASCSMLGPIDTSLSPSQPLVKTARDSAASAASANQSTVDRAVTDSPADQRTQFFKGPAPTGGVSVERAPRPQPAPTFDPNEPPVSAVMLDGLAIPQFINTIYATILKRNVSMDPAVLSRTDLVSLRTGKPQTPAELASAAQAVLRSYGLAVNEFNGLIRVVPAASLGGASPEILRGRAQPDVPGSLRPIFYLYELDNTNYANAITWVRTIFQGRVTVTEDPPRNAIMLSGQSDSVLAAVDTIRTLDRPGLRGRLSVRFTPVFWSATDLANRLVDVLGAQGYSASQNPSATTPLLILPIVPINAVLVFAVGDEALNHTLRWARELDQTPSSRSGGRYITYYVRNTDAAAVAKTLQEVLGGATTTAAPVGAAAAATAAQRPAGSSRVVVNAAANSIIIQSSPTEYPQIYGLLQELDRPAKSALIMATIAEVRLTDDEQFGFNWLLQQFTSGGYNVNGGLGPVPVGGAVSASGIALNVATLAGNPRALLTALSTSSRVRVLSNPSIVAINGQSASMQIGQDVPILTSQISNTSSSTTAGQSILQTVQYRNVGIILKVKPVIHSGGRIDLEINQEVSGVSTETTGLGNSPVVNTRRIDTRLSVIDGNTMLIGGLISEQRDGSNAGIPFLKDIPLAGGLFRTSANDKTTRTELVLLITPHVIEDDFDSRAITDAFKSQFSWGKDVPLSVKLPVTSSADRNISIDGSQQPLSTDAANRNSGQPDASKVYVIPAEAEPTQAPNRPRANNSVGQNPTPPGGAGTTNAPGPGATRSPTDALSVPPRSGASSGAVGVGSGAGASAIPATPGGANQSLKPLTDEALRQELLKAIQQSK
jgi:general secretion pathway protein D